MSRRGDSIVIQLLRIRGGLWATEIGLAVLRNGLVDYSMPLYSTHRRGHAEGVPDITSDPGVLTLGARSGGEI